ncbi:MAG: peptidase T [Bacteroides sp.]|nr:peptidase T [Prevotella sp.]MCM1408668.1 peptidase T [Treponema brennaborense]MCM1470529.1 peptidase T [Bacteroides sp.]
MALSDNMQEPQALLRFLAETDVSEPLLARFLSYVRTDTQSDSVRADQGIQPSAETERAFAESLAEELRSFGIHDVRVTEHAYVCARIPPSCGCESFPSVCFIAHLDTAEEVSGKNVRPQVFRGKNENAAARCGESGFELSEDAVRAVSAGDTVITSDGTTLLGADDKAGIAVIMTAAEYLLKTAPSAHGQIEIIFSPDEETGHGMDNVPFDWIRSPFCYTVDGGRAGEIECECFNAWKSTVRFIGKAKHTGTARPDMVNAVTMAAAFISLLPQNESPEATDALLGFYAPMEISGHIECAEATVFLRDFDDVGMQRRIAAVDAFAKAVECRFPGGRAETDHTKQYLNMKTAVDRNPAVLELLVRAVKKTGIEPVFKPIRGGTDGSRLSEMGLPTPNIFTGGHNFHSRTEWASLSQMTCAVKTLLNIVALACAADTGSAAQADMHKD